jgi:hypothetical protein
VSESVAAWNAREILGQALDLAGVRRLHGVLL